MFFTDDDRRLYLRLLREQSERHGLAVHGFCLMTNHVHLVATPAGPLDEPRFWTALAYVEQNPVRAETVQAVRRSTRTGWPLGSDRFIANLEAALGRRLRPMPIVHARSNPARSGAAPNASGEEPARKQAASEIDRCLSRVLAF